MSAEHDRLREAREGRADWRRWGPYLSERAWGTVREDYSADGNAWDYFPFAQARSRAYRWNEDGLAGISDSEGRLCLALALWNERDPILKERLFGLDSRQGNHGEDVKEIYFYLDATPSHSYMHSRYRYPLRPFPYDELVAENASRGREQPEYELTDTDAFADGYFQIDVTIAKLDPDDLLIRYAATRIGDGGGVAAPLHLLPTLWFRNTWSWRSRTQKPSLCQAPPAEWLPPGAPADTVVLADSRSLGERWCAFSGIPRLLFCENETNSELLWKVTGQPSPKDAIGDSVVGGKPHRLQDGFGTKVAAHYRFELAPGEVRSVLVRLSQRRLERPFDCAEPTFRLRKAEADEFYASLAPSQTPDQARQIQRQAFAGLLWSKQFYHYNVDLWLRGDPAQPLPPGERWSGRNRDWRYLNNADVISMPDKWEYPWYAAWDLAFHCIPLALVDPDFAKEQLVLMLREWYMHPNGQIPAYEWALGDVNPPVHAWAAWRVYKIDQRRSGTADLQFLERVFHKLLLNFTWWVNRKDSEGNNVFQGGFLGLDNISIFDRTTLNRTGAVLEQADATSWMAMYCLNLLRIALELALHNPAYEDVATKFFEHFLYIAHAMNNLVESGIGLWDDADGFFYDLLHCRDGQILPLRVRSIVGLIPLFATETLEPDLLERLPGFARRFNWFIRNRPRLAANVASLDRRVAGRRLLSVLPPERLRRLLTYLLDPAEFLSDHGIRALSRYHLSHPVSLALDGQAASISYEPAESCSGFFGGNSNWRGPIWFPINYLIIESLQKLNHYYRDDLKVPCPTGSDRLLNLGDVAIELSLRLVRLFMPGENGCRPVFGPDLQQALGSTDEILFYEYFHGDSGRGLGASHQTGWTALVAKLIAQSGDLLEGLESEATELRSLEELRSVYQSLRDRG